ncbi:MAG: endonuclease/exonuclease/phosphatase family protein [Solirubrobacterales bacterium]
MALRALTWNLFHGRDFPPDPALVTRRSRLLRVTERNATHLQVNRYLLGEFAAVLAGADWDVALLQECPPRWSAPLARACGAQPHLVLTSRNSFAALRAAVARISPDLIASNEGGSNLTLVRPAAGAIVARDEITVQPGPVPERRAMALTRLRRTDATVPNELSVANLHLSAGTALRPTAEREVLAAAGRATAWAGETPLVFGGDLNLRPAETGVYERLAEQFGLTGTTGPDALDHLLVRGLDVIEPPSAWPPARREVRAGGLAIRLSDHAPVEAAFEAAGLSPSNAAE